jgi:hypothetical protein
MLPVVDVYGFRDYASVFNESFDAMVATLNVMSTTLDSILTALNTLNTTTTSISTVVTEIKTDTGALHTDLTNIYSRQHDTQISSFVDVRLKDEFGVGSLPATVLTGLTVTALGLSNPLPVTVDGTVPVTLSSIDTAVATGTLLPVTLGSVGSSVPAGNQVPVLVSGTVPVSVTNVVPVSGSVDVTASTAIPVSGTVAAQCYLNDVQAGSWVPELGFSPAQTWKQFDGTITAYVVSPGAVSLSVNAGIIATGSDNIVALENAQSGLAIGTSGAIVGVGLAAINATN